MLIKKKVFARFFHEVAVVLVGCSLELITELGTGAAGGPKKTGKRGSSFSSIVTSRLEKKRKTR